MRGVEKSVEREERACASAAWCLWCVDGRGLQSHRHSNEICWVSMSVTSPTSSASCLRPRLQLTWNGRTVYGQVGEHLTPRARETRHVSRGSKRTVVYEWANDEKLCATTHTHTHTSRELPCRLDVRMQYLSHVGEQLYRMALATAQISSQLTTIMCGVQCGRDVRDPRARGQLRASHPACATARLEQRGPTQSPRMQKRLSSL
jgi:hypothetical protein